MFIIQLILIQVFTFGALVFVLRKIMYSASYLETRRLQQLNNENTLKAQELAVKIEEAQSQYQQKLADAEAESRRLKSSAKEEIDKLKQQVLDKARQESERIIAQALNSKEKIKEEIEANMQEKCVAQSLSLIREVLGSKSQSLMHEGFVDEIIKEIEEIDVTKLQIPADKGELIIASAISETKKSKIASILSDKAGRAITLEATVNNEIIAGIIIKLGSFVIDASLAGKLKEAAQALNRA